jgi:hypothetical protein
MLLPKDDAEALLRTRLPLLLYADRRLERHPGLRTIEDLTRLPPSEVYDLSVTLCGRRDLLDDYLRENPDRMPPGDLAIVEGYRHAKHGKFIMLRHTRSCSLLLSTTEPPVAYAVLGITDELSDMVPDPPVMLETVLLPIRGRFTYDGALATSDVRYGPGIRRSFEDGYREARARSGIVASLPFTPPKGFEADEARLRGLLASEAGLAGRGDEIRELAAKDRRLLAILHGELGRTAAKAHRTALRKAGAEGGWYASLEGVVVAGGTTREDVERTVEALVPEGQRGLVHVYGSRGR